MLNTLCRGRRTPDKARSLDLPKRSDVLDDLVRVRESAGLQFRVDQFVVDTNLELSAAGGNQGEACDVLFEFEQLLRQTDGLRFVVSNTAVFDRNLHGCDSVIESELGQILTTLYLSASASDNP